MEEVFFVCDKNRRLRHIRFPEASLIVYSKETLEEPYICIIYTTLHFVHHALALCFRQTPVTECAGRSFVRVVDDIWPLV